MTKNEIHALVVKAALAFADGDETTARAHLDEIEQFARMAGKIQAQARESRT